MKTAQQIKEKIANGEIEWFGRDTFIQDFSDYLLETEESKHVCLKGIWGSGKTTTIFGIIEKLKEEKQAVLVLYLDAWKYENYEHPTYALLKAIQESDSNVYNRIKTKMKEKKLTYQAGVNLPFIGSFEIGSEYSRENHKIISEAEYIEEFNQILIKVIKEYKTKKAKKLIIFVDELDRAKPDFALRVLETFHHLHDELPTHFVYSADIDQLNSMIKHYYGYEYNTEIFLHKVFDDVISLPSLSLKEMEKYIDNNIGENDYDSSALVELVLKHLDRDQVDSLRSINYVLSLLNQNLNRGYFLKRNRGIRSEYYLGKDSENESHVWGYMELLIILITKSIKEAYFVEAVRKGHQIDLLAKYIQKKGQGYIKHLIKKAYIDGANLTPNVLLQDELTFEQEIEGIKNIFNPPKKDDTSYYGHKSVFEDIII